MRTLRMGLVVALLSVGLSVDTGTASSPESRSSENIRLIGRVAEPGGTGGARLIGHYFYVSTAGGMRIYDVSDPRKPRRVGALGEDQTLHWPHAAQEDPDTNGDVYLSDRTGGLEIIDVADARDPHPIGQLGRYQHTWTCIKQCRYAYGADGLIVDLRNPEHPKEIGNWQYQTGIRGAHDVTAVTDNIAVVSTTPLRIIDTSDPRKPKVVAQGEPKSRGFAHGSAWPRDGRDRFLIMGTEESFSCNATPAFVATFDTRRWRQGKLLARDEWRVPDTDLERSTPVNILCGHWFDPHPRFHNGGLVAAAWYEDGMRLLQISPKGKIREVGYYIRENALSSAAYWITDNIIYVTDYYEGFDILRVDTLQR